MNLGADYSSDGGRATGALTVLGLETSCDETAAAVVRRAGDRAVEVMSSVIASQVAAHRPFGGVVPEIAARAHVEVIDAIVARAMDEAGVGYADLDGVAATARAVAGSSSAATQAAPRSSVRVCRASAP